jgi:hypothetical protein
MTMQREECADTNLKIRERALKIAQDIALAHDRWPQRGRSREVLPVHKNNASQLLTVTDTGCHSLRDTHTNSLLITST